MTKEEIKEWCLHHYRRSCKYNKDEKCTIKKVGDK